MFKWLIKRCEESKFFSNMVVVVGIGIMIIICII